MYLPETVKNPYWIVSKSFKDRMDGIQSKLAFNEYAGKIVSYYELLIKLAKGIKPVKI